MRSIVRVLGAVGAFVLLAATPAVAEPPAESGAVARGTSEIGGVYWEDGYIVLAGNNDFVAGCQGVGFVDPEAMFVMPGNGSFHDHVRSFPNHGILVFDTDVDNLDDVFPWVGAACGAALDGDPTTVAPEPVAVGVGRGQQHVRVDTNGVAHIQNSVIGRAMTTDGRSVHVSARAKFTQSEAGLDVQQLRVRYGG